MEDKLLVAKTLLECYKHIDDLYGVLTAGSESCVRSGFYAVFPSEQMSIYERIMRYEERKVGLYNMKYLVEESFRRGKSSALSLLKEKYIHNQNMNQIMERYGACLRTCYRHLRKGFADFCRVLEAQGFDKKRILTEFGNEPLFQTMLTKVIREDDSESAERSSAEKKAINNRRNPLPLSGCERGCYFV